MSLQEFINKNRNELRTDLRCGSCGNSLQHCGKYTIEKVGLEGQGNRRSEEGILCETCGKAGRKLVNVTRIYESPTTAVKQVAQFRISDIDPKQIQKKVNQVEKFKKIEAESVGNIKVEEEKKSTITAKQQQDKKKED